MNLWYALIFAVLVSQLFLVSTKLIFFHQTPLYLGGLWNNSESFRHNSGAGQRMRKILFIVGGRKYCKAAQLVVALCWHFLVLETTSIGICSKKLDFWWAYVENWKMLHFECDSSIRNMAAVFMKISYIYLCGSLTLMSTFRLLFYFITFPLHSFAPRFIFTRAGNSSLLFEIPNRLALLSSPVPHFSVILIVF